MSSPHSQYPDKDDPVPQFLRNGQQQGQADEMRRVVEKVRVENPAAYDAISKAVQVPSNMTDEQYVANSLDQLNHRRMKKIATEMLAGREEKPMTAIELADMLAEWADKNRSDHE